VAKVLVVEDDPTMAEMVAYNLRRQGLEVETTADGLDGLRRARATEVALLILDLMLPSMDGLTVAEELRRARPEVPILMLTARAEESTKLAGFAAGIDDYLTKPFSMEELVARVKALLRRARAESVRGEVPAEMVFGDMRLVPADLQCSVAGVEVELRPKEFALLATLAAEPGRLLTRQDLARRVWEYDYLGSTRTIDTHVKNVRRKVEEHSGYTYIDTVRGAGYRFRVRPKGAS